LIALLVLFPRIEAAVTSARLIDASGNIEGTLYYEAGTSKTYKDAYSGLNDDIGLEIVGDTASDVQNKWIGLFHAANTSSVNFTRYIAVGKNLGISGQVMAQTGMAYACDENQCANVTPVNYATMDSLITDTYGVPTGYAAYPGRLWIIVSDNQSVENGNDTLVILDQSNGYFKGSFTYSTASSNYNQETGNFTFDITGVTVFTSASASQAMDSKYEDKNYTIVGICQDTSAMNCNGTDIISKSAGPISLATGIIKPNDQSNHTKYIVVNGFASSAFCIGANLQTRESDFDVRCPDATGVYGSWGSSCSMFYGQTAMLRYRTYNSGNVNQTTDFNQSLWIENSPGTDTYIVIKNSTTITENLTTSGTSSWVYWNWTGNVASGAWDFRAITDQNNNISECTETASDQLDQDTITINKLYTPYIYINGTPDVNFTRAGIPANISIYLNDSDGIAVDNARIRFWQVNAVNIFAPSQNWTYFQGSATKTGLYTIQCAEVRTNDTGWTESFTLIPTDNPIYRDYPEYELDEYIGDYNFYMTAVTDGSACSGGTTLSFSRYGGVETEWDLYVDNTIYDDTGFNQDNTVANQNNYVQQIMDWAYTIFSMINKWLLPI